MISSLMYYNILSYWSVFKIAIEPYAFPNFIFRLLWKDRTSSLIWRAMGFSHMNWTARYLFYWWRMKCIEWIHGPGIYQSVNAILSQSWLIYYITLDSACIVGLFPAIGSYSHIHFNIPDFLFVFLKKEIHKVVL